MLTLIALIISIILQFFAALIAIRLTKKTKYRLSWILITVGLLFMAIRRFLELISFLDPENTEYLSEFNNWLTVFTSFIITAGVILIGELFNFLGKMEKQRQEMENKVLHAIIKTEETERKRFARDLHDGLGPLLSNIKMSLSSLKKTEPNLNDNQIFCNTEKTINESIKTIKELSNNISPHILINFGLYSAVKNFISKISGSQPINIDLQSNFKDTRFSENTEVILYRVICELITNTIKHANAKNIDILMQKHQNLIQLRYSDDGIGFNFDQTLKASTNTMGLKNIVSRIKSANGHINAYKLVQGGMRIEIKINIQDENS